MTVYTLQAPMPELTIPGGTTIKFEAISPTTGLAITGVTITTFAVYGYDVSADTSDLKLGESGPFMLVPGPSPVGNPGDGGEAARLR